MWRSPWWNDLQSKSLSGHATCESGISRDACESVHKRNPEFPDPYAEDKLRKILVSVKFVSAILGPEMPAPILWAPGKKCVLSAGKPVSVKFLVLGGGGYFWVLGGGEVPILFLWARGFFLINTLDWEAAIDSLGYPHRR